MRQISTPILVVAKYLAAAQVPKSSPAAVVEPWEVQQDLLVDDPA